MEENNDGYFFEGVEKLLEVWFAESSAGTGDLRNISRLDWENLLCHVKCEIISFTKNDLIDAFLLSESSMFVSRRRWILKTCGTTTPLKCLDQLLQLAREQGYTVVTDIYYSRKNFTKPEVQNAPHRGFYEEVYYLDTLFPEGRSYCLGSINQECWYLYTFSKPELKALPDVIAEEAIIKDTTEPDQTIEILMQNLDQDVMSCFSKSKFTNGREAAIATGIQHILPDMLIDDFLFDPCGYSMNGINERGEYMTIHITPEEKFSYVSFESNVDLANYTKLINHVIKTFKPGKFLVTIFANKSSLAYETMKELESEYSTLSNWQRNDMQCCNFPLYNLLFAQYSRKLDSSST
ncbi:SamDC [Drosophila busckii]|uniref:S-adenosylmethionine decarboxylase proenzyme n=1 Tax=Drosophila busckii TaxID=30019 RepID=A0A0M4EKE2_DROBS|nr:S-adenosylmethionine decarboxylase proenzyme [Drosophila busckii]XP_017847195.1 S-adenosylmethionine decarboxylase proenzyme [Drosophila busckii]ALC47646.1 SamDC [Drosophila busckii]